MKMLKLRGEIFRLHVAVKTFSRHIDRVAVMTQKVSSTGYSHHITPSNAMRHENKQRARACVCEEALDSATCVEDRDKENKNYLP